MTTKWKSGYNLTAYSAAALWFIVQGKSAYTQVIYTDVDPDIVLDEALESAGLDIDNNGTIDFAFLNSSFTYYNGSWLSYRLTQDLLVGPYSALNGIAGNSVHFSSGYGGVNLTFPYALHSYTHIGGEMEWHNGGTQVMALKRFYKDGDILNYYNQCFWFNFDIQSSVNRNLAIKFIDLGGIIHYGWIRCSVLDSGRTLIIHDYAYNAEPETGLLAGTLISTIQTQENNLDATVYSFDKDIYIIIKDTEVANATVTNLNRQVVLSLRCNKNYTVIPMVDYPPGVYFVHVQQGEKGLSKKVLIR
ncbi:MAG: T9SS type A sorting domain-containing protein [Chitinophagales bacterium]